MARSYSLACRPPSRLVAAASVAALLTGCDLSPEPLPSCGPAPIDATVVPRVQSYRIVATYPHDREAFTQGLVFDRGDLFESTGLYGASTLRRVALESGVAEQEVALDETLWGEGLALWQDRLVQLTWKAGRALIYERESFEPSGELAYATEGWGLTQDGESLVMSDGTATLYFLDPETFEERRRVQVTDGDELVVRLNELESIHGEIWANVWLTERIARIDPDSGRVLGWVLFDGLGAELGLTDPDDVLNGIAFDSEGCRLLVTGKRWPSLFEVEVR